MFTGNLIDKIYMKDDATERALFVAKQLYPNAKIIYRGVDINENTKEKTTEIKK